MTMIINVKKQFFWTKIQKNLLVLLVVITFAACSKKEPLQIASFQTPTGWGYTISNDNKILIKQSIIPVISQVKSFESEEDALKVANLVAEKLSQNISPSLTKNDLILLKIKL